MNQQRAWAVGIVGVAMACGGAACGGAPEEETGSSADEVTSAGQLGGSDMPAGSYALTFDDGPGPRTEELANYLGDRGIVGTFFINGRNAPAYESALVAIKARGHILANHTQNHEDMRTLQSGALYRAVADTDAVIARHQPAGPWLLRAPYGAWDGRVSGELNATAMSKYVGSIFWNVGGALSATTGADWACWGNGLAVDDCANRYMSEMRAKGRGIILIHDSHGRSVDMTKTIVESLEGSVRFVPLTDAPQIASAIGEPVVVGGGGGDYVPPAALCPSFTLGRSVPGGTCVRRNDDGKWYRCDASAPADWPDSDGPGLDPGCTSCPQLPNGACE
ncbi:MAG: polysaccharide deacetylase family protein [Labilithrix sp.]|nr:polysaccharide deacetylase family protein [Labilithrix sp.]